MPALPSPRLEAAAHLRAQGRPWQEIVPQVGYASEASARTVFARVGGTERVREIQAAALSEARLHLISTLEHRVNALGALYDAHEPAALDGEVSSAMVCLKALQGAAEEVGGRVRHSEHTETTVTITEERRQLIVRRFGRAIELASKAIDVPGSDDEEQTDDWFAGD